MYNTSHTAQFCVSPIQAFLSQRGKGRISTTQFGILGILVWHGYYKELLLGAQLQLLLLYSKERTFRSPFLRSSPLSAPGGSAEELCFIQGECGAE